MSNETMRTPAEVRERVAKEVYLWEATRFGADECWALRRWREESNTRRRLYFNVADRILALLRTPCGEGEGEAQPWRKVGEEPPPNGVQVLVYDPRPDGYSYAGCWAYTLIRKGDQFYLDGERCDEEVRSRLNIEEWLWQPLPPYPGSRSKDADVRDTALRELGAPIETPTGR